MMNSFKRGIGYQIAKIVVTLFVAFIIAVLTGKVHAASISTTDTYTVNYYQCTSQSCVDKTSHFTNKGTKWTLPAPVGVSDYYKLILMDTRFYSSTGFKTGNVYKITFKWALDPRDSYMSKASNYNNDLYAFNGSAYTDSGIKTGSCSMSIPSSNRYQMYYSCLVELSANTNYLLVRSTLRDSNHIISNGDFVMYEANVTYEESADIKAINQQTNTIINQTNEINSSVNDVNDSINDDSVGSDSENSSKINSWSSNTAQNGTITQLITLPITLYSSILNNINGTCNSFNLGSLYGSDLSMSCINIQNYVGSSIWSVIDMLFSGFFILVISKQMIKVFNNISSMKDGDILD